MKPEEALEILRKPELPDLSKGHIHTIGEPKRISMSEYMEARKMAIEGLEKQALTERAISAFIGQSGENDGYLGCYMVHRQNHQHCQTGDTVKSLDELVEWYKENFPEEVQE